MAKRKDPEGAKEVTMNWVYRESTSSPQTAPVTDFQKLNKIIAMKGKDALTSIENVRDKCMVVPSPILKIAPVADASKIP